MDLKSLEKTLQENNENYLIERENMKKLVLDTYSKLPLKISGLEKISKMAIPFNPHSFRKDLFIKVNSPKIENKLYVCSPSDKIEWLRENICKDNNIAMEECILLYNSKIVNDGIYYIFYHLKNNSIIRYFIDSSIIGGKIAEFNFNNDFLAPNYDYDFPKNKNKNKFYRGGLEYNRPYGWKRYALNVLGKYENDLWIGSTGKSNNDWEWAVAYHITKKENSESIYKTGLHPGNNNVYGAGVYCIPNIETAYSSIFKGNDGNNYKLVFQVRAKPSAIIRCIDKDPEAPNDYW